MRQSQDQQIRGGARLLETVRENEGELPGVAPFLASLEKVHAQAVSAHDRRKKIVAAAREATKQSNEDLAAAREAAIALRCFIKGVLGFRNPKLTHYGIRPRRKRGRPRKQLASCGCPS
jgi:hypothetical protein